MHLFDYATNHPDFFHTNKAVKSTNFSGKSNIFMSKTVIQLLKSNSRKEYRELALKIESKQDLGWQTPCKNRVITIKNALITSSGIIICPRGIWKMGGCADKRTIDRKHAIEIYNNASKTHIIHEKIVSVAAMWASGVWHFPMEALVGLKLIDSFKDVKLHISKKSDLCLDWIKLVKISPETILDGSVFAKELVLPEMGRCGNPYYEQLVWLKERVFSAIPDNSEQNLFILIKRNARRSVKNHDLIETICKNFCKKRNLDFYLHDDLFLPSLGEQMTIFNKAKIVMGPHGGGGVNLIATKPKTSFIEFISESDINICYTRISHLLNIDYSGLSYSLRTGINIIELIYVLNGLSIL